MAQVPEGKFDFSHQYIFWNDRRFSIENDKIDSQHKRLIDICNRLYESHRKGETFEGIRTGIREIVGYARTHFKDEEAFMAEIGYPGLDHQRKMHEEFIGHITEIFHTMRDGEQISAFKLLAFLKDWIEDHIENEDKLLGKFLRTQKVEAKNH